MTDYPVNIIEACIYKNLPKHTKVWNTDTLEHHTWINVPVELSKSHELFQVDEISSDNIEVDFTDKIMRECNRPWFKVTTSILNTDPGQHIYKMSFINRFTNDISCLYFSYIIQDDDPEKPYIYMNRDIDDGDKDINSCTKCPYRYEGWV